MGGLLQDIFEFIVNRVLDARAERRDRKARAIERKQQLIEQVRAYRDAAKNRP